MTDDSKVFIIIINFFFEPIILVIISLILLFKSLYDTFILVYVIHVHARAHKLALSVQLILTAIPKYKYQMRYRLDIVIKNVQNSKMNYSVKKVLCYVKLY